MWLLISYLLGMIASPIIIYHSFTFDEDDGAVLACIFGSIFWPILALFGGVYFAVEGIKHSWKLHKPKNETEKKQMELEEMALHHLFSYPEKWNIEKKGNSDQYSWTVYSNKSLAISLHLPHVDNESIAHILVKNEKFPLSFRTITRLEKEEENKKKALEFNRQQVIQLQKHTAIHDAKDRLWAELQQKAQA